MYKNNLSVAVSIDGKILREVDGNVYLPFGCEYSIHLKNTNSVSAVVNILIDGESVSEDGFIVDGGSTIIIGRSIRNGNLKEGNRFKFIQPTSAIIDHRGARVGDSLIEVRYQFAKRPLQTLYRGLGNVDRSLNRSYLAGPSQRDILGSIGLASTTQSIDCSTLSASPGITVPGSISNQEFMTVPSPKLDPEVFAMTLQLLGVVDETPVTKPTTVKTKQKCPTCGKMNRSGSKFCSECGTSLRIFE
jgi:hypothetical protein